VILGDREFGSVKLANWLCTKKVKFVLRVKEGRYIRVEGEEFKRLSEAGLKYVGRMTEWGRKVRRHSSFWVGLYGYCWVVGMEFCEEIVGELIRIRSNKLPFFQKGMRARNLILPTL